MNRNRNLLGVLGIVAAAVIIYFGFFYPQPDGDDLSATIGTVTKHQNEQISNEDVVLAGEETTEWSDDPVVVEAMASILERATIAQRSFAYLAAGRKAKSELLLNATAKTQSPVLGKVDKAEQVAAFYRVEKDDQKSMLARMEVKAEFGKMSLDQQVHALGTLGAKDRANILARVNRDAQIGALAKCSAERHSEILGRASKHQLARVFVTSSQLKRVEMLNDMPLNERQALMGKVFVESSGSMLRTATPIEMENLRKEMSNENAAALFSASSVHDQLVWAGRAVRNQAGSFELSRVAKKDDLGRLFLHATPEQKVAFFRAQPANDQRDLQGKMSIKQDAWGDMDLNAKASALSSLSLERQAAMLAHVDKAAVLGLARHANLDIQRSFLGGLSRVERANFVKLGASSSEVNQALGRHPEIRNAVFSEIPTDVQMRIMGRLVRTNDFR